MELTEPFEAAVVAVAQIAEFNDPEAGFFSLHIAAGLHIACLLIDADGCEARIAALLAPGT